MPNINVTWEPGSVIKLCNVPWDSNYDNVVAWAHGDGTDKLDLPDRDEYFDSLSDAAEPITLTESAYCPMGQPIQVAIPFPTARNYNYLMVENPRLPSDWDLGHSAPYKYPTRYFYFIVDCQQPNPASSLLTLQLDVWTTYYPKAIKAGVGYVERGHVGLVNKPCLLAGNFQSRAFSTYLCEPEGIDVGSEFQTVYEECHSLQSEFTYDEETGEASYADAPSGDIVIVVSTADLTVDPGTISSPSLTTASGEVTNGLINGCNVYALDAGNFVNLFKILQRYSWVSQCIISLTIVPGTMLLSENLEQVSLFGQSELKVGRIKRDYPKFIQVGLLDVGDLCSKGWENDTGNEAVDELGYFDLTKYSRLYKLWTYPFTVIEITGNGQSIFLKPQLFAAKQMFLYAVHQEISPFTQIAMFVDQYGTNYNHEFDYESRNANTYIKGSLHYGDFLDTAIWWEDFPQFSVTNNSYIAFMASTAHTRDYQYSSAAWSFQSANMSAANTYANNQANLRLANENAQLDMKNQAANNALANASTMNNIGASTANGIIGSVGALGSGNVTGAITGTASTLINANASLNNLNNTMQIQTNNLNLQAAQLANSQDTGYAVADRNYSLSKTVAQGNYDNQVAGIDAGYADAALKSPSSSGNVGGNGMRYSNGHYFNYQIKVKRISDGAVKRVGDYFLRFGYTIHRFIEMPTTPVFNEYYSYWKVQQLEIQAAYMTETEKDAFRGIYSKGVTIWRDPSKIGFVRPVLNQPLPEMVDTYYI